MLKHHLVKTNSDIAAEWDQIAEMRSRQLQSGIDLSFEHILVPCIKRLCHDCDLSKVVDIGCSTGFLTAALSAEVGSIVGIDISARSIELATKEFGQLEHVSFVRSSIEEFCRNNPRERASLCIANMTLMDVLDLDGAVESIAHILSPKGVLAMTITHPWFWPKYSKYDLCDWFDYHEEIVIQAPFTISLERETNYMTTHVHRSLERYITSLKNAGFVIESLFEPMPTPDIEALYPQKWLFPRFLAMRCRLT
jgi:SAM-dependent methyltransferase